MSIYSIFFELFGKKMRVNMAVESAKEARKQVRAAIIFRKIERQPEGDKTVDYLKNLFGMFDEVKK